MWIVCSDSNETLMFACLQIHSRTVTDGIISSSVYVLGNKPDVVSPREIIYKCMLRTSWHIRCRQMMEGRKKVTNKDKINELRIQEKILF